MRLPRAGSADQNDIVLLGEEGSFCKLAHELFVDRRVGEVEVVMSLAGGSFATVIWYLMERACFSAISDCSRSPTMGGGSCSRLMPEAMISL